MVLYVRGEGYIADVQKEKKKIKIIQIQFRISDLSSVLRVAFWLDNLMAHKSKVSVVKTWAKKSLVPRGRICWIWYWANFVTRKYKELWCN